MTEPGLLALIHAEIDGELDAKQAAELARELLARPEARALRDGLRRLCTALDSVVQVEPPPQFRDRILAALPRSPPRRPHAWLSTSRWRYAALFAGVLAAGAIVYQTVRGPRPAASDAAGTMGSDARTTLDSVRLGSGPISGQVELYRDRTGLGLEFDLVTSAQADALVSGNGRTIRVSGLGGQAGPGTPRRVALPGLRGPAVQVIFLVGDDRVGGATLHVPEGR